MFVVELSGSSVIVVYKMQESILFNIRVFFENISIEKQREIKFRYLLGLSVLHSNFSSSENDKNIEDFCNSLARSIFSGLKIFDELMRIPNLHYSKEIAQNILDKSYDAISAGWQQEFSNKDKFKSNIYEYIIYIVRVYSIPSFHILNFIIFQSNIVKNNGKFSSIRYLLPIQKLLDDVKAAEDSEQRKDEHFKKFSNRANSPMIEIDPQTNQVVINQFALKIQVAYQKNTIWKEIFLDLEDEEQTYHKKYNKAIQHAMVVSHQVSLTKFLIVLLTPFAAKQLVTDDEYPFISKNSHLGTALDYYATMCFDMFEYTYELFSNLDTIQQCIMCLFCVTLFHALLKKISNNQYNKYKSDMVRYEIESSRDASDQLEKFIDNCFTLDVEGYIESQEKHENNHQDLSINIEKDQYFDRYRVLLNYKPKPSAKIKSQLKIPQSQTPHITPHINKHNNNPSQTNWLGNEFSISNTFAMPVSGNTETFFGADNQLYCFFQASALNAHFLKSNQTVMWKHFKTQIITPTFVTGSTNSQGIKLLTSLKEIKVVVNSKACIVKVNCEIKIKSTKKRIFGYMLPDVSHEKTKTSSNDSKLQSTQASPLIIFGLFGDSHVKHGLKFEKKAPDLNTNDLTNPVNNVSMYIK